MTVGSVDGHELEHRIARLLTAGTYASVALLAIGTVLLLARGGSPLDGGPGFEPARLAADLRALRPAGFLWLGLVAVIATPSARVVATLVAFTANGERRLAAVALLVLAVIALSVVLSLTTGA